MNQSLALDILGRYYTAFNSGDAAGMLECLADDVMHDINEGGRQQGKDAFRDFLAHMDRCYSEQLTDLVLLTSQDGKRGAAEFTVNGTYKVTDDGLPEASGQKYVLPAGAFFAFEDGLITRVSVYYNLADWTRQVAG